MQNVNDSLSDTTTTLAKKVADAQKQLEDGRTAMQQSAASLNSRMNSIASGKTTDKETLDARVDSAGKTYDSFGAHLRSRADKFYANGMPFSYTGAVNLNTTEHQLEFSGNFIYLGAKGNKLLTKPEPVPYNPDALFVNLSVSSARWCDYEDSVYDGNPVFSGPDQNHNNVMGNQVEKLIRGKDKTSPHYKEVTAYADFDMILIACGTNDGVPSGDMEGSFTSENEMVAIEELDRKAFHGNVVRHQARP